MTPAALCVALALAGGAGVPPPASAGADGLPLIVRLADGTSVPLRAWTFSYEYLAWTAGSSQALATAARRGTRELCVLSYSVLVECGVETAGRVVRIEFPEKE